MPTNRAVIDRYVEALTRSNETAGLDALDALRHDDFSEDWPQTGERIQGAAAMRAIDEHHPNRPAAGVVERVVGSDDRFVLSPAMTLVQVAGAGDAYTIVMDARYQDGSDWYVVMLVTLRDGLVWRVTTFFAPRLEAPEWRAQWTAPIPGRRP